MPKSHRFASIEEGENAVSSAKVRRAKAIMPT